MMMIDGGYTYNYELINGWMNGYIDELRMMNDAILFSHCITSDDK